MPRNVALLRVVPAEAPRFLQLAKVERKRLGRWFVDRTVGPDMLRVLGIARPHGWRTTARGERARDDILRELGL